jgi:hypothetical protein
MADLPAWGTPSERVRGSPGQYSIRVSRRAATSMSWCARPRHRKHDPCPRPPLVPSPRDPASSVRPEAGLAPTGCAGSRPSRRHAGPLPSRRPYPKFGSIVYRRFQCLRSDAWSCMSPRKSTPRPGGLNPTSRTAAFENGGKLTPQPETANASAAASDERLYCRLASSASHLARKFIFRL